ncbi:MAG TPA: ATP-dependent DNA ligase, partial [Acidimicrobiales bacterium]|nr:ATP-dependent DNA ligase [Acidimicrobiales bacterium]
MVEAAGHDVPITHPEKVFFSEHGETKGDLAEHYLRVEAPLMRTMGGRPVLLQRFPEGAGGPSFFQKRVPKSVPDWLQTTIVSTPNGTTS